MTDELRTPERTSTLETKSRESGDSGQNHHVIEMPAVSAAVGSNGEEEEGNKTSSSSSSESNRLSNGLEAHQDSAGAVGTTSLSPRSSALQDNTRLSSLSTSSSSSSGSNGYRLSTEQEVATSGEASMEIVDESVGTNRHENVKSISEETRELDEFLNRSSVTSVLTDSQISSLDSSISHQEEGGGGGEGEEFERIVGGGSSEEDLERERKHEETVRYLLRLCTEEGKDESYSSLPSKRSQFFLLLLLLSLLLFRVLDQNLLVCFLLCIEYWTRLVNEVNPRAPHTLGM